MKVAYFSPMPPEQTGIADYSALLLPALARARRRHGRPPRAREGRRAAPTSRSTTSGNNPDAHAWIVDALRTRARRRRPPRLRPPPPRRGDDGRSPGRARLPRPHGARARRRRPAPRATACSTSGFRRSGSRGPRTSRSRRSCSSTRPALIVHSPVRPRPRARRGLHGADLRRAASGLAGADRRARARRERRRHRLLRRRELEQADPGAPPRDGGGSRASIPS